MVNFNMNRFTVSQVNGFIKQILSFEEIFYGINVEGEIFNFKYNITGHMYFTLKDEKSSISCVVFKDQADTISFIPKDGMFVVVHGDVGVYEVYGKYQIYIKDIKLCEEEGEEYRKLKNLKEKLLKEGILNLENKKEIPKFPKKIGVIAAKSGAAIEDVLKIINSRYPIVKVKIYYSIMQGKKAVKSIINSLKKVENDELDVLILARGGGSKEDLKTFDDEDLVKKVCKLKLPVVSAIGHENNWSIIDFVADLRASTPSNAAELICPDMKVLLEKIEQYKYLLKKYIKSNIDDVYFKLKILRKDFLLFSPTKKIENLKQLVNENKEKIKFLISKLIKNYEISLNFSIYILKNLNPKKVLNAGYALVLNEEQKIISSSKNLNINENLNLILKDGKFKIKIVEKF